MSTEKIARTPNRVERAALDAADNLDALGGIAAEALQAVIWSHAESTDPPPAAMEALQAIETIRRSLRRTVDSLRAVAAGEALTVEVWQ